MERIYKKLGYHFKNFNILKEALTHPSFNSGLDKSAKDYERLEFLGDSVLLLVITDLLINEFKFEAEGHLAKRRALLISKDTLYEVAKKLKIAQHIYMSEDEIKLGGQENPNILEDVLEAIIGAIYLDSGIIKCKNFISEHWLPLIRNYTSPPTEAKSSLQEWSQERNLGVPEYQLVSKEGKDHKPFFTIAVSLPDLPSFLGKGESKKVAEKNAAQIMLDYIKTNDK